MKMRVSASQPFFIQDIKISIHFSVEPINYAKNLEKFVNVNSFVPVNIHHLQNRVGIVDELLLRKPLIQNLGISLGFSD